MTKKQSLLLLLASISSSILCYLVHEYALDHGNMILAMLTTILSIPLAMMALPALFDLLALNDPSETADNEKV